MTEWFEPKISLGTIVQLVVLVAAVFGFWWSLSAKLTRLEIKVDLMWDRFRQRLMGASEKEGDDG